jgi:hypothetical protein
MNIEMMERPLGRVYWVDCIRAVAVLFALISHALSGLHLLSVNSGIGLYLKAGTRLATPALLIVFGMMVEMVYFPRWQHDASDTVVRLVSRAFDSALAVLAGAILIDVLAGDAAPFSGVLLLQPPGYFTIYQLYAFLLPLCPLLLLTRERLGPAAYLPIVAIIWLYHLAVSALPPATGTFAPVASFFGVGGKVGPTPIHALQFVLLGMAIAQTMLRRPPAIAAKLAVGALLAAALIVVASAAHRLGGRSLLAQLSDIRALRGHNYPAYYAIGAVGFVGLSLGAWVLSCIPWRPLVRLMSTVGSHTFSLFFIGNAILLACGNVGWLVRTHGNWADVVIGCSYLACSVVALYAWLIVDRRFPVMMAAKRGVVLRATELAVQAVGFSRARTPS